VIVDLSRIRLDGGTQSRADIDQATVEMYAEAMRDGATFPPVVLFFDGQHYWLADGFQRHAAKTLMGSSAIVADVKQGTRRDAVLYSVGANATHGKPRTNADKRRAVALLLGDDEWRAKSDSWIAEKCAVTHPFVGKLRSETAPLETVTSARESRDGRTIDVSKIGKTRPLPTTPARQTSLAVAPATDPEPAEDDEPESERRPAPAVHRDPAPAPEQHKVSAMVERATRDFLGWVSELRPHEKAYVKAAIKES